VSATTGRGLDALRAAIVDHLADAVAPRGAEAAVLLPRHRAALASASAELDAVLGVVAGDAPAAAPSAPELVGAHLRAALDAVGTLCGAVTPDDVLGRIFASFCIGK
jgi:tRNA modification GTPase